MIDECVGLIQLDEQERERLSHIDGARLDSGFFFPRENRESFVLRVPHRVRFVRALRIHRSCPEKRGSRACEAVRTFQSVRIPLMFN